VDFTVSVWNRCAGFREERGMPTSHKPVYAFTNGRKVPDEISWDGFTGEALEIEVDRSLAGGAYRAGKTAICY